MATLRNSAGETFEVSDADAAKMQAADPSLTVVGDINVAPHAPDSVVASEDASRALSQEGTAPASSEQLGTYAHRESLKGKTSAAGAAVRSALGGATFGISDKLFDPSTIEADAAIHPVISTAGTLLGALAGGEVAGGLGLFKEPADVERAASALSSKALFAGETTGAADRGLAAAGEALDAAKAGAAVPEDLAALDAKGLRAARDTELDRLAAEQTTSRAAARTQAVADVTAYRTAIKQANPWLVIDEGENASRLNKANRALRNALDDVKGLEKNPSSLLKPLRVEEKALEGAIADQQKIAAKLDQVNAKIAANLEEELATLPDAATHVELTGKAARRYAAYADVKVGKSAAVQVAREDASRFLEALRGGEVQGESAKALQQLPGLLEQNRALQAKIEAAVAPLTARSELTSARLAAIADAQDALVTGKAAKKASFLEDMLGGSIMGHVSGALSGMPIVGKMVGAKAGQLAKDLVFGKLGAAAEEGAARTGRAIKAFLDTSKRAAPIAAPVLASKVLGSVQYASSSAAAPLPRATARVAKTASTRAPELAHLFAQRAAELRSQTVYGPDGAPVMTPAARQALGAQLAAIRAVDPLLADKIETIKARGIEFLSSKLPRRPDVAVQVGPDRWQPSDMEMRTFARYVAAVEDPHAVLERLAAGSVTPEDAEAMRAVYPEMYASAVQQIVQNLPTLRAQLPYQRRIALSIFSGVPVDPALDPRVLAVLQSTYAGEDGTEGGTQAPTPQPAFGSVSKEEPTAAQRRAG